MRRFFVPVLLVAALTGTLHAQQDAAPPATDAPYVLHVYQNLVQMVTLVVTPEGKILPPVPKSKFAISIDAGPKFPPTQMHLEGDDPISLSILIDATGDQRDLIAKLPAALDSLAPGFLHPEDHINMYAYDCILVRSTQDQPALASVASKALTAALSAPGLHGERPHHHCKPVALWDAAARVTELSSTLAGRRVLLILSDGRSSKGHLSPVEAIHIAGENAIAIFGMRDLGTYTDEHLLQMNNHSFRYAIPIGDGSDEDLFDTLCQKNGGLLSTVSKGSLPASLQHFVSMLRNRYILEFPRPNEDIPGRHEVDVTIPGRDAYIRPAGITLPPATKSDPNALPPSQSPATFGRRRPVDPGQ